MSLDAGSYCGGSVDRSKDPIWDTPLIQSLPTNISWTWKYNSPRCGGWYSIHDMTINKIEREWSDCEKARLTSWLIEQRRSETECPRLTEDVIQLVKQRNNMSVSDRADAILKFIDSKVHKLDKGVIYASRDPKQEIEGFTDEEMFSFFTSDASRRGNYYELIAFSESIDYHELNFLLDYLKECKWIKIIDVQDSYLNKRTIQLYENGGSGYEANTKSCLLTVEGHARLAEIQQLKTESSRKFETSSRSIDQSQNINENDKIFISYSWDNEEHKQWVQDLTRKLRGDGINATLDVWELAPGDQLTHFMEREIRESKYVLIVCTPSYREKSNLRQGGVGYEDHVMTAEMYTEENHRKFIPVFAKGCSWNDAAPSWLIGKLYIDLSTNESYEEGYSKLKATLLGERPTAPPVRRRSPNK